MKKVILTFLAGLLFLGAAGCSSIGPLKPRYYRKNIVVKPDRTLWLNGQQLNLDNIRQELVKQMVFEETPIAVHFHKRLPMDVFDTVMNRLKDEGYRNYECVVYRD